jgi:hypothetical protein
MASEAGERQAVGNQPLNANLPAPLVERRPVLLNRQCPYCLDWYFTDRGMGVDQPELARHARGRCKR